MTIGGVTFERKLTLLIIFTTIVPMIDYYNLATTGTKAYDRLILYFILPMLFIRLALRESPRDYGWRWGDWRAGLAWTAVGCAGMALILWAVARLPAMEAYYSIRAPENVGRLLFINAVDLFGWEFIWRGLLLFGFARAFGPGPAIFLHAVPFAFMHLGKPPLETFSTIFGGAAFGFVAWKTRSFVYPWLIHWFITSFTMLIASGRF
jgi:uncharacterized protein